MDYEVELATVLYLKERSTSAELISGIHMLRNLIWDMYL
jgi:hypothetical protein